MQDGKLEKEDHEYMKQWIKKHWKNDHCPFCEQKDWLLMPYEVNIKVTEEDNYPYIAISCKGCGYTAFLNAVVVSLMTPQNSKLFIALL